MSLTAALEYARKNSARFENEYKDLLRIPSVSTLPAHKPDMQKTAEWIASQFKSFGFSAEICPTGGHPAVVAEHLKAGPNAPTVLVYGHYDVQPAEPLDLWVSPAFEPTQRGENLYARGASDMKGQLAAFLKGLESYTKNLALPVNFKCLIEGEEEIGSKHLAPFIKANKERLKADYCLNLDAGILAPDRPGITYALRGLCYFELRLTGPSTDLHSGMYGGAVMNPGNALSKLIAGMHDADGRVMIPGFYDDVCELTFEEREEMATLPTDEKWWEKTTGVPVLFGEKGFSSNERATARPTLDVNGMLCGFTGEGSKTVLPSKAMAKFSTRLVADQDPKKIEAGVREYLEAHVPASIKWELLMFSSGRPSMLSLNAPYVKAATQALEAEWGVKTAFMRQGGSIPVVGLMQDILEIDSLLLGFGLPDDNLHAPNEKQHLPTWHKGVLTYVRFLDLIGAKK